MNTKSTSVLQSKQTSADSHSIGQDKAPVFRVQTGMRAGELLLLERADRLAENIVNEVGDFLTEFRARFNPFV